MEFLGDQYRSNNDNNTQSTVIQKEEKDLRRDIKIMAFSHDHLSWTRYETGKMCMTEEKKQEYRKRYK